MNAALTSLCRVFLSSHIILYRLIRVASLLFEAQLPSMPTCKNERHRRVLFLYKNDPAVVVFSDQFDSPYQATNEKHRVLHFSLFYLSFIVPIIRQNPPLTEFFSPICVVYPREFDIIQTYLVLSFLLYNIRLNSLMFFALFLEV